LFFSGSNQAECGPLFGLCRIVSLSRHPAQFSARRTYILCRRLCGGSTAKNPFAVRVVDEKTKKVAYTKQTQAAQAGNKSNCPLCAVGHDANKARIYDFDEMDADHVAAWSKGGDSSATNCQMLCTTHNRVKGNR